MTTASVKKRSVAFAIVFSILTCGIYALYWYVCLTNDTNRLSTHKTAGGIAALFFNILTCGIYSFYWHYMLGKKIGEIEKESSSGVLYLVLSFFGLGIIAWALAQAALNRI